MAFDPETQLDDTERVHLAILRNNTPGFNALQKIFESEIAKFHVALVNSKTDEDVLNNHKLEKAASAFYVAIMNRINYEMEVYSQTPKKSDAPLEDITEGVLDMGGY